MGLGSERARSIRQVARYRSTERFYVRREPAFLLAHAPRPMPHARLAPPPHLFRAHGAGAAAQTHVESEAFGIGARIDDDDARVRLLAWAQHAIRRDRGIQVFGRLEFASSNLFAPTVFEHELQQRIGLRELGEIRDARANSERTRRARVRDHAPLSDLIGMQIPIRCERDAYGAIERL